MDNFFIHMASSSLCLIIFYFCFKVFLSRETFFSFNRFFLLAGIIICLILPFIKIQQNIFPPILLSEHEKTEQEVLPIEKYPDISVDYYYRLYSQVSYSEPLTTISEPQIEENSAISWNNVVHLIYASGILILAISLFVSILKMGLIIRKGKKISLGNNELIITRENVCPFSFGKYIVLSQNDYNCNAEEIIRHEMIHARKKHTIDSILVELLVLVYWFNPAIWLIKRELKDIHEYEADHGVINSGINAKEYQLLLVKKAVGARSYAIANSFNHSKIKNRITMMLKERSNQKARLKTLVFVPLAAIALFAFAQPATSIAEESLINSEVITNPVEINVPPEENLNIEKLENPDNSISPAVKREVKVTRKAGDLQINADSTRGKRIMSYTRTVTRPDGRRTQSWNIDFSNKDLILKADSMWLNGEFDTKTMVLIDSLTRKKIADFDFEKFEGYDLQKLDSLFPDGKFKSKVFFNDSVVGKGYSFNFKDFDSLRLDSLGEFTIDPERMEKIRKQFGENLYADSLRMRFDFNKFKLDEKQLAEINKKIEELQKNFEKENHKQQEEFNKKMEELHKNLEKENEIHFKEFQKHMEEYQAQMEKLMEELHTKLENQ